MDVDNHAKRITVKLKSPNPLFEKWLTEWRDKATENDSKMQHTFNIALKSLRKYPIPFESGKDCVILKGFGPKLCGMLDEKLKQYKSKRQIDEKNNDETSPKKTKKQNMPKKTLKKLYIPTYRSGPYAILLTMLRKSQNVNYSGSITKHEIIDNAKDLCDKSFTKPDPGSFYTAWSSMSNLISKNLVKKKGNPAKFLLTPEGFEVALKLVESDENNDPGSENKINTNSKKTQDKQIIETVTSSESEVHSSQTNSSSQSSLTVSQKTTFPSSSSQTQSQLSNTETIIFAPNTFDIILLVDTQETEG